MATFDEEHSRTTEKMADMVMEYVAQFIARDYLESYEKAAGDDRGIMVPQSFDEKIYKKIAKQIKANAAYRKSRLRRTLFGFGVAISLVCFGITVFVLLNSSMREALMMQLFP